MSTHISNEVGQSLCKQFNAHYPPGSDVDLILDDGEPVPTKVKWPAGMSINGPVVGLEYSAGNWLLERVIPVYSQRQRGSNILKTEVN